MGKVTGFTEWPRKLPKRRDVADRLTDWNEFYVPQEIEESQRQGGRCMDCGVPFCQQGCPLGNQIPDWNDLVYRDRWRDAHVRLASTNNFPEFTGRLCPAPCEAACVLAINADAVTIEQIEKEIIERAFAEGWVVAEPPAERTGKRVAVVGSGPAGLAAAAQLNSIGHAVTVYEAADRLGGLLRYGIPDFKMEKWVIDRRIEVMEKEGIEFQTGVAVGDDVGWDELREQNDALLIAVGSRRPRDLQVPGRDLHGVVFAMDFLTRQNRINAGDGSGSGNGADPSWLDARGKQVIILGGGDTGSDCLGTSLRQGAARVHQIELLPMPSRGRDGNNPWPQWPLIFRTSSSQEEGGERDFALLTKKLTGSGGKLTALQAVRIDVAPKPSGGLTITEKPGEEVELAVDLLILAMGYIGPEADALSQQLGVKLDQRGNVHTDQHYATNVSGVYCAGDAHRGQSLIVWAIAEGREAARAMDSYLRDGRSPWLPTRGADYYFGGR
ncbi:MAG: glutamate synthase subunit beta [Proteobacteria bacterium]|nr:glutamate synthase subunit beta [Pseudomonadota bacterium]